MAEPHERLRRAREESGLSPGEVAETLQIPKPTYYSHENGTRGFAAEAERYARFFRVSYEWLMTGKGGVRQSLDARLAALSPEQRAEVLRFMDYIEQRDSLKSRAG